MARWISQELCPRKVWGSPGWRCVRKQRQMSARSWLAQNRALGHRGQRLMEGSSSAAEKPNLLVVSTIFHQHQINHHYTRIPSHSNVAAETARNIISILEAHRAQDLSGQIINQMNFNRSRTVLTTSEHRLVWILSIFLLKSQENIHLYFFLFHPVSFFALNIYKVFRHHAISASIPSIWI